LPVVALGRKEVLPFVAPLRSFPAGFGESRTTFREPRNRDENVEIGRGPALRSRPEAVAEVHPFDGHPRNASGVEHLADAIELRFQEHPVDGRAEELPVPVLRDLEPEVLSLQREGGNRRREPRGDEERRVGDEYAEGVPVAVERPGDEEV
jgi:hypothetical protein